MKCFIYTKAVWIFQDKVEGENVVQWVFEKAHAWNCFLILTLWHPPHLNWFHLISRSIFSAPKDFLWVLNNVLNEQIYFECNSRTSSAVGSILRSTLIGAPTTVKIGFRKGKKPQVYWKTPRPRKIGGEKPTIFVNEVCIFRKSELESWGAW